MGEFKAIWVLLGDLNFMGARGQVEKKDLGLWTSCGGLGKEECRVRWEWH